MGEGRLSHREDATRKYYTEMYRYVNRNMSRELAAPVRKRASRAVPP